MSSPVIKVDDLWFSCNGNPVLKNVNLTIYPRDFLAVIGPNGGGKTTLIKLMLGLLAPDRGTVRVFGHSPREASVNIGYGPQDIEFNKSFPISVRDVVLMGRMRGSGGWRRFTRSDKIAARHALERVEMWEYHKRCIGELSGGQRQRVFMARRL